MVLTGSLSPQLAPAVLGEHPEEPSVHRRRSRDGGRGRVAARRRSDIHGRLHQDGAQTQQSECKKTLHLTPRETFKDSGLLLCT